MHGSFSTVLAALSVVALAATPVAAQAPADTASFAPTTAAPWNPARPVLAREPWEMALDLPLRLATLPVSALGLIARHGVLQLEEHALVPKALYVIAVPSLYGFSAMPASLGDRTGLGGEVGWSPPFARRLASVGLSGSTGGYSRLEARLGSELGRFEYVNEWRPHDPFFGIGMDAEGVREGDEIESRGLSSSTESYRLTARVPLGPFELGKPPRHTLNAYAVQRKLTIGEPQGDPEMSGGEVFDRAGSPFAAAFDREQKGTGYGVFVSSDLRSGAPHWSRGGRVRAGAEFYDPKAEPDVRVYTGPAPPGFAAFQRYTLELEGALSFSRDPRTVRLALRVVDTELDTEKGPLIADPDLAVLGGSAGLAGFEPGRFHDLDLALARLSYIFPLAQHFELDLHVEGGGVWNDLQHQARLTETAASYGIVLRPRTKLAPVAAIGIEGCREGIRFGFSLGAVE